MNSEQYDKLFSELADESINQTETIHLYHEEPSFDTSGLDTSDIIQPLAVVVLPPTIYQPKPQSTPVNTYPIVENRELFLLQIKYLLHYSNRRRRTTGQGKEFESSLEKYLRPQTHDDHVIDVDQRQALI
ncbi:hypothetical protein Ocin01_16030 [Orchesella cincta]|uniref:Uncharacterized protein n=1 Tax=Orchesella cincta TaxID=48709 RepID=A0A1D2MCM0_ORCCI|nr:hypothetical protein Ocin01_16030 [Orchesella cincta]